MKTKRIFSTLIASVLFAVTCVSAEIGNSVVNITPQPQSITISKGVCKVGGARMLCDKSFGDKTVAAVDKFSAALSQACGSDKGGCRISFTQDLSLKPENYTIKVSRGGIKVTAADRNGVLYAIATLKQMMPVAIYGTQTDTDADWNIPCCTIVDGPRFAYRGMHLDPCRHFWSVEETKRYIDIMAVYKLNRLHWHLTDDQGWRIEIKSLPLLTEVGAWRNGTMVGHDWTSDDGIPYGGFYTQEEIKEVIEYADARGITIIPEVDLPGHMVAALAAYPELGCFDSRYEVRKSWGIAKEVLCPGKEVTFGFLEKVLGEVADLFPSEYIHIGGDECPKVKWENCPDCQARIRELGLADDDRYTAEQKLQNYVTARVQKFLASKGKKIIGWDEILEGDNLSKDATVMSWRGTAGGIEAAKKGLNVIMSPYTYCYLDYCQSPAGEAEEPLTIGGFLDLAAVYGYEPYEGMEPGTEQNILGPQCNLWTEYIATPEHLEYMLLPRMIGLSEVAWTKPELKDYDTFLKGLREHQYKILDVMHYNYRRY